MIRRRRPLALLLAGLLAGLLLVVAVLTVPTEVGAQAGTSTSSTSSTRPSSSSTSSTTPDGETTPTRSSPPSSTTLVPLGPPGPPVELATSDDVTVDDPRIAPRIANLVVDGEEYRTAVAAFHRAEDDHDAAVERVDRAGDEIRAAQGRRSAADARFAAALADIGELLTATHRVEGELIGAERRRDKAAARLTTLRGRVQDLAVTLYIEGGVGGPPEDILDPASAADTQRNRVLLQAVQGDQLAEVGATARLATDLTALADTVGAELRDLNGRLATRQADRDQAQRDQQQADRDITAATRAQERAASEVTDRLADIEDRRHDVADARLAARVPVLELPFVVLNAYVRAADTMADEQPSCGLRWSALAGIGRTESNHGTFGGTAVGPDGNLTGPINGPLLDGSAGNASIADSDGGEFDGDPNGDHATGPMQFIPQTWRAVARDADGDGKVNPQNYYDATLAAAIYLCRRGPGLETDEGMRRAFFSYNHDDSYVELVLARTHEYDRFSLPPPPP